MNFFSSGLRSGDINRINISYTFVILKSIREINRILLRKLGQSQSTIQFKGNLVPIVLLSILFNHYKKWVYYLIKNGTKNVTIFNQSV